MGENIFFQFLMNGITLVCIYTGFQTKIELPNSYLVISPHLNEDKEDESATSSFLKASPTSSHLLPGAKGSTPKPLSKKELKKLRQKNKKKLVNMQAKEAEDIPGDDDNLKPKKHNF
jgi:hypothetical protein